jgi:hypothetical protein
MMKPEKKISNSVWLELRGYRVVALKPEFAAHAVELQRAIHEGIAAHTDTSRVDFYDVALDEGSAYIHLYRDRHVAYLVSYSRPQIPPIPQINWRTLPLLERPSF